MAADDPLPPATAAVIDYQRVMREARAAQSIRNQVEARRVTYQDEIAAEEQRLLLEADRELARQRGILAAEAFAGARKTFEEDVARVQRFVQERRQQLDDVSAMALGEVREAVIQVVGELAGSAASTSSCRAPACSSSRRRSTSPTRCSKGSTSKLPDVRVPERAR